MMFHVECLFHENIQMGDTEISTEPDKIKSESRDSDFLEPERYERGDAVTLAYYSLRHQMSISRCGIVWEPRSEEDEIIIAVENFGSKGNRRNAAWTVQVLRDGTIKNNEKRSGSFTRVKIGEEASLAPGWR